MHCTLCMQNCQDSLLRSNFISYTDDNSGGVGTDPDAQMVLECCLAPPFLPSLPHEAFSLDCLLADKMVISSCSHTSPQVSFHRGGAALRFVRLVLLHQVFTSSLRMGKPGEDQRGPELYTKAPKWPTSIPC